MGNPYAPPPTNAPKSRPGGGQSPPGPAHGPRLPHRTTGRAPSSSPPRSQEPGPDLTPEQVQALARRTSSFALCTVAGLAASALPLPWGVLGGALSLVAVVLGVRTLVAAWRTSLRRRLAPVLFVGLTIASLYTVSSFAVVATWPIQVARQDCMERALTISARQACEAEFRAAIEDRVAPDTGATP